MEQSHCYDLFLPYIFLPYIDEEQPKRTKRMAFSMSWYIPDRVMLLKLSEHVTADDVKQMDQVVMDNRSVAGRMVHQCIDVTEMTKPPSLGALRQHAHETDEGDGYVIVIGTINRMVQFVLLSIAQVKNIRLIVVPTLDQAIEELRALDPSLRSIGVRN